MLFWCSNKWQVNFGFHVKLCPKENLLDKQLVNLEITPHVESLPCLESSTK